MLLVSFPNDFIFTVGMQKFYLPTKLCVIRRIIILKILVNNFNFNRVN